MNKIAKIAALLVALATAFSFSQENLSVPTEKPIVYDTIHRVILDSVTIKALENTQKFYSDSFNNVLWLIGIIIAIFGGFGAFNWWKAKEYSKETKEALELLDKKSKDLFGEVEYTYLSLAITSFKMRDYEEHFRGLAEHFKILTNRNIRPENLDFKRLTYFYDFIEKYNNIDIELAKIFLYELNEFIKYGEAEYPKDASNIESAYLIDIKKIWLKLCDKLGGQDRILEAIKDFNYNTYNFSISKREFPI